MFEDSTFESMGTIHTRSRGWMLATLALNSTILLAIVVVPLVYPEVLPLHFWPVLIAAPASPPSAPPTIQRPTAHSSSGPAILLPDPFRAPTLISGRISLTSGPQPAGPSSVDFSNTTGDTIGAIDAFQRQHPPTVVHPEPRKTTFVPSSVAAGMLIYKVIPQYPALARTMRVEGTVSLAATISRTGTIANLHVVSGPTLLQSAAVGAVSSWRYRPYMLNGQPVDVETTINVVFTLGN
jgi:protein TonB